VIASYGALPAAHRDLIGAADGKTTGLAGIIALGEEATRLNGLVTQLTKANAAAAAAAATCLYPAWPASPVLDICYSVPTHRDTG
jgi:hypothetical protein